MEQGPGRGRSRSSCRGLEGATVVQVGLSRGEDGKERRAGPGLRLSDKTLKPPVKFQCFRVTNYFFHIKKWYNR